MSTLVLVENEVTYGGQYDHWQGLIGVSYHLHTMLTELAVLLTLSLLIAYFIKAVRHVKKGVH